MSRFTLHTGLYLVGTLLSSALSSCEHSVRYRYMVTNNADTAIAVFVKNYRTDTTYIISKDSTVTIFNEDRFQAGAKHYFQSVSKVLDSIAIFRNNTPSLRNYRDNATWSYDNATAVYQASVSTGEF